MVDDEEMLAGMKALMNPHDKDSLCNDMLNTRSVRDSASLLRLMIRPQKCVQEVVGKNCRCKKCDFRRGRYTTTADYA